VIVCAPLFILGNYYSTESGMAEELEKQRAAQRANRGDVMKLTKEVDTLLAEESIKSEKIARLNVIFDLLEHKIKIVN